MTKIRKILIVLLIISLTAAGGVYFLSQQGKVKEGTEFALTVTPEKDGLAIATELEKNGIVASANQLYKEMIAQNISFYANTYLLKAGMSNQEIIEIINNPVSNYEDDASKLVIYEGMTSKEIAATMAKKIKGTSEQEILAFWKDKANLTKYMQEYTFLTDEILNPELICPLEGYFGSATYQITEADTIDTVTRKMLDTMSTMVDGYDKEQFNSLHEFLTFASIVQRETLHDVDTPKIAGVFMNRLNANPPMPIQSDITVLYALGVTKTIVTFKDLEVDSPFNTYKYAGLPPGPISTVGAKTLDFSKNYDKNDYLFFFAKQDTGEVLYSKTYEEHLKISEENAWQE